MAYEKQTWETGQVITAEKLNHMEDGIEDAGSGSGGSVLPIKFTYDGTNCTCDKSFNDIIGAITSGTPIYALLYTSDNGLNPAYSQLTLDTIFWDEEQNVDIHFAKTSLGDTYADRTVVQSYAEGDWWYTFSRHNFE